jgi:hypothetical protein
MFIVSHSAFSFTCTLLSTVFTSTNICQRLINKEGRKMQFKVLLLAAAQVLLLQVTQIEGEIKKKYI